MKTNYFTPKRISILFSLTALFFTSYMSKAQLFVNTSNKVGIGTSSPSEFLEVAGNVKVGAGNAFMISTNKILWNNGNPENIFAGVGAGNSNTGLYNSFMGYHAGYLNTISGLNSAFGFAALASNTSGYGRNSAFGYAALCLNSSGYYNVGVGSYAMYSNTAGLGNTGCGYYALQTNSTGNNNTALGYYAWGSGTGYSNSTALGAGSSINASDQVRVGNVNVLSIGGFADWTNLSDVRFKKDIQETVPGLAFILKLRPVTYHLDMEQIALYLHTPDSLRLMDAEAIKGGILQTGFIAQEVELSSQELGFDFSGVDKPKNENDYYGLRYAEFVVPLVKAVQELSKITDTLTTVITKQDSTINAQNSKIDELQNQITNCCSITPQGMGQINNGNNYNSIENKNGNVLNETASNLTATLYQNVPNPFNQHTKIEYFIPANTQSASIMVFDLNGKLINTFPIRAFGKDAITINGSQLNPGMFVYSLIVDEKIIDTKRMILTH